MFGDDEGVSRIIAFIRTASDRSLCVPRTS